MKSSSQTNVTILNIVSLLWKCCDHKTWLSTAFILVALGGSFSALTAYLIGSFVDTVTTQGGFNAEVQKALWILIGANAMSMVCYRSVDICNIVAKPTLFANMRRKLSQSIFNKETSMFTDEMAGNISSRVNNLPASYNLLMVEFTWVTCLQVPIFMIAVALAFKTHVYAGLALFFWAIANITFVYFYFRNFQSKNIRRLSEKRAAIGGYMTDAISNIFLLITSKWNETGQKELWKSVDEEKNIFKRTTKGYAIMWYAMGIFELIFITSAIYFLGNVLESGEITLGAFIAIIALIFKASTSAWSLGQNAADLSDHLETIRESLSFLNSYKQTHETGNQLLELKTAPSIEFKDVGFQYNNAENTVLNNFSLKIKAGERVGIVGRSGAGKSTLVNLVLRFYDIDNGKVLINDENIKSYQLESYRSNMAVIPQDTSLFHKTLFENICFGCPDATEEDVHKAAKKAHIHEFILSLDDGYQTQAGDRGVKLSGGQRQRIAIARAILKGSPVLILDEATSALDSESEKEIQDNFLQFSDNKTTVVVAHRLATLKQLDRILVLDNGQLIEEGSHKDLIKQTGLYAALWEMQSGGFLQD